jgi:hypothetical protein
VPDEDFRPDRMLFDWKAGPARRTISRLKRRLS